MTVEGIFKEKLGGGSTVDLDCYYSLIEGVVSDRSDLRLERYPLCYRTVGFVDFLIVTSLNLLNWDWIYLLRLGIHGDENKPTYFLAKRLNEIVEYAHSRRVGLIIEPAGGPSGLIAGTRYNADGDHGPAGNNDFLRYRLATGGIVDDLDGGDDYSCWYWASEPWLGLKLPQETRLEHRLMRQRVRGGLISRIRVAHDIHEHLVDTSDGPLITHEPGTYHYLSGNEGDYRGIIDRAARVLPLFSNRKIFAGHRGFERTNSQGTVRRHDGTLTDLTERLGIDYNVATETIGNTTLSQVEDLNWAWFTGLIDLGGQR